MIDDRSSTVSLPEVPLLAVLPGTGGLTRLTDKRRVRRDLADVFCTTIEGVRADRALAWGLVDAVATPKNFADTLLRRAHELTSVDDASADTASTIAIALTPLERQVDETGLHYPNLDVAIDRGTRVATFTLRGPDGCRAGHAGGHRRAGREMVAACRRARTRRRNTVCCEPTNLRSERGLCAPSAIPTWCGRSTASWIRTRNIGSCARRSACGDGPCHVSTCRRAPCSH